MTTKIYAHRETTPENAKAVAKGDVVAEIKHDLPLDLVLNGLQTGRFGTQKPDAEPANDAKTDGDAAVKKSSAKADAKTDGDAAK